MRPTQHGAATRGHCGFRLTDRDAILLRDLYDSTVLSLAQIRTRHFPAAAHSTVVNRLSCLKRAGLVCSTRVGIVIHHGLSKEIGVVYRISRRGIGKLTELHPEGRFRELPLPVNTASLVHDLVLTDTVSALKARHPGARVVNGKLLAGTPRATSRNPDAVLFATSSPERWAVELELSAKSSRRYREIVTSYRLSKDYDKVLYVVARWPIAEAIQSQIMGLDVTRSRVAQPTGRFYFAVLRELLANPDTAQIANATRPCPNVLPSISTKGGES
ncbi:MAG: replication-relaxation family protein [Bdellovibrionales bacterium]|nr:replication-relaxation family protein [Bdellovibrionales bacterium]